MITLIVGLVLFLGAHSTRIVAEGWRASMIESMGEKLWKGVYSVVSIAGFVLIVVGYALARETPTLLWGQPPVATRHLAALLTLVAFVLLVSAYVPRNQIRPKVHHPMVLGVALWAIAHLVANNTAADVVLFGSFLAWAVLDYRSARKREATRVTVDGPGTVGGTVMAVGIGVVAWAVFAFWIHLHWIGVAPLGRSL